MATLLGDLVDRIQRLADRVDATYRQRALDAVDEAVQWYASRLPWDSLNKDEEFITNGTRDLVLPDRVNKVIQVGSKTDARPLDPGTQWERRTPGQFYQDTGGRPLEWRDAGYAPVIAQPATDSTLAIVSTVSEAMEVMIEGTVRDTTASGTALEFYEVQETVTLAGASVNTSNAYTQIQSITKPKNSLADVRITNTQTGLQIARIPKWETRPIYRRLQLHFIPGAGHVIHVWYFRRPNRIVSEDASLDPAINEEAVLWRATGNLLFIDNEDQAANSAWGKADQVVAGLRNMEETFGEEDHHIEPWPGYLELENLGSDEDFFY